MRPKLRVCPRCSASVSTVEYRCPKCGYKLMEQRSLGVIIIGCGLGLLLVACVMFYWLSQPPIALMPLQGVERSEFNSLFLNIRLGAFAVLTLGVGMVLGGAVALWRIVQGEEKLSSTLERR